MAVLPEAEETEKRGKKSAEEIEAEKRTKAAAAEAEKRAKEQRGFAPGKGFTATPEGKQEEGREKEKKEDGTVFLIRKKPYRSGLLYS